jgi:uncharacterized protein YdiU (UPF0061 family)
MDENPDRTMNQQPWPNFDNSYARLPERFFSRLTPVPVSRPGLIRINHELAMQLGFVPAWLESQQGVEFIAGNFIPDNCEPIATVYAGHQFGGWNPQLGDGRAILMGEVIDANGRRFDIQLKGSGRTPYSRGGDGRAPLGPVLREYIVSEAMAALGVPTSRALGAVTSGEKVYREHSLPGAVLARVAGSHIRIGTIQYFASHADHEALDLLVRHVIQRHYPALAAKDQPVLALLDAVIGRQAILVALWQSLGFIHGVMNTDNMLLSGETIDYGPCAFMDGFHEQTVYSSIDHGGRYAYRNQPHIAHWNLTALAQALLPLLDGDPEKALATAQASVDAFPALYQQAYRRQMLKKLGLTAEDAEADELIRDLFGLMQQERTDFTLTFRHLSDRVDRTGPQATVDKLFQLPDSFKPWIERWEKALTREPVAASERQACMYRVNPVYIPRNHLVEQAIQAAERRSDYAPFHRLVDIVVRPHGFLPENEHYALPPRPEEAVTETFCGT